MNDRTMDRTSAAFAALEEAVSGERIRLEVDLKKVCHPHCPLPFDHYKTRIAYGYIGLMIVLFAAVTVLELPRWLFWSTLAGFILVFWIGIRPFAERWVRRGVIAYILDDPVRLEKIWRYGGVRLVAADGSAAVAPGDDWRRFVLPATDAPT